MDKMTKETLSNGIKNKHVVRTGLRDTEWKCKAVKRLELTPLAQTIQTTPTEATKFDKYIKNLLAYKPILARIFKETVYECKDMSYEEIEKCIEGEPDIAIVGVNPGYTNQKIEGQTQENTIQKEQTVYSYNV